jgi:hypothetical protein
MYRESAWPPAQAKAQKGGGSPLRAKLSSVACQIGMTSVAR